MPSLIPYVREKTGVDTPPATKTQSRDRPPRMASGHGDSYQVDLSASVYHLLLSGGPFYEWMDWQYPASVRKNYRYANDQIPSAAIGDFDGDGSADVAIHGNTGRDSSKVICLLSNNGERRAVLLLGEPNAFEGTAKTARSRPTLFLTVLHAGEEARDRDGRTVSFARDVIVVARPGGHATPYYYVEGEFRTGRALASPRWNALEPR